MSQKLMQSVVNMFFVLALVACGGSSSSSGGPCNVSLDCPQGQICDSESLKCIVAECANNASCSGSSNPMGTEICAIVECNGPKVCTAVECGQSTGTTATCLEGESCVASAYFDAIDNNGGFCRVNDDVCTTTGPDGGPDTTEAKCPTVPCGAGTTCDTATGTCVPSTNSFVCSSCSSDSECGGADDICSPFTGGSFCTESCASEGDCPIGFTCYEITNNAKQCVPYSYNCSGCIVDGCPAGQVCNYHNGSCVSAQPTCGSCLYDYQCSSDGSSVCFKADGNPQASGVCAPACDAGNQCPGNSSCTTHTGGGSVCAFSGSSCCYGNECSGCNCSAPNDKCLNGQCVQCLSDADCAPGTGPCDLNTHTCANATCPPTTPYLYQGACVECLNGTHCASGTCDVNTHSCTNDLCSSCIEPYPACADIGGQLQCVQCTAQDTSYCDTIGGVCDVTIYTCEGGNPPIGNCGAEGCPPSPFSGEPMICDASGACIDPSGQCDGVTAMCPNGECASLLDGMMGGAGGGLPGIPGLPTGSTGIPGVCSCDSANGNNDCGGGLTCVVDQQQALMCAFAAALSGGGGDMTSLFTSILSSQNGSVCLPCGAAGGLGGLPLPFP